MQFKNGDRHTCCLFAKLLFEGLDRTSRHADDSYAGVILYNI